MTSEAFWNIVKTVIVVLIVLMHRIITVEPKQTE